MDQDKQQVQYSENINLAGNQVNGSPTFFPYQQGLKKTHSLSQFPEVQKTYSQTYFTPTVQPIYQNQQSVSPYYYYYYNTTAPQQNNITVGSNQLIYQPQTIPVKTVQKVQPTNFYYTVQQQQPQTTTSQYVYQVVQQPQQISQVQPVYQYYQNTIQPVTTTQQVVTQPYVVTSVHSSPQKIEIQQPQTIVYESVQQQPQIVYQQPQSQIIYQQQPQTQIVYEEQKPQVIYQSQPIQQVQYIEAAQPTYQLVETRNESEIKHQNYQSFTYSEKVPYTKKVVDYVPVQKIEYVPKEREVTDYYEVEYQVDYVPQKVHEKVIEYIPQEVMKEKIQYKPVARKIIKQPQEVQTNEVRYITANSQYQQFNPQQDPQEQEQLEFIDDINDDGEPGKKREKAKKKGRMIQDDMEEFEIEEQIPYQTIVYAKPFQVNQENEINQLQNIAQNYLSSAQNTDQPDSNGQIPYVQQQNYNYNYNYTGQKLQKEDL